MNKKSIKPIIWIVGFLLSQLILYVPPSNADIYGRIDIGFFSFFPDDSFIQDRTFFTQRIRLGWEEAKKGGLAFSADMRLRKSTVDESGGPQWQIWDLRMDYGLNKKLFAGSIGICYIREVAGLGSVMGGHFQTNPTKGLSLGLFGGANPRIHKGGMSTDGIRAGAYICYGKDPLRSAGFGFVYVDGTHRREDVKRSFTFDSRLKLGERFFFYQSGEIELPHSGKPLNVNFYYGNVRYEIIKGIRTTLYYSQFSYLPYLQYKNDLKYSNSNYTLFDKEKNFTFSSRSISPRIDFRFASNWRVYFRYRWRWSDYGNVSQWHQYSGGISCGDLFGSGVSMNGMINWNNKDKKDYQSGYISFSRDLNRKLSLTVAYAGDRYQFPENLFLSHYVSSTQRASASLFYRITKTISLFLDYERSFGDNAGDHQVLFNCQHKF